MTFETVSTAKMDNVCTAANADKSMFYTVATADEQFLVQQLLLINDVWHSSYCWWTMFGTAATVVPY